MSLLLLNQLQHLAQNQPDAAALVEAETGVSQTWAQLWNGSMEVSAQLARDLRPGSVVILCSPNRSAFVAAFVGILAADCKVFPLTPQSTLPELEQAIAGSKAAAIIADAPIFESLASEAGNLLWISLEKIDGYLSCLSPSPGTPGEGRGGGESSWTSNVPHPNPPPDYRRREQSGGKRVGAQEDLSAAAMLLNSSGSTGSPKIVHRSARALDAVAQACWKSVGFAADDHVLAAVPLCHSFGVEHGLLAPLCAGSCVHLCRGFDLHLILKQLREDISIFPVVPFMVEALASSDGIREQLPALRQVYSAGAPLPASVAQAFADRFGIRVGQVYGATEIGSVTFSDPNSPGYNAAGVGQPMPSVEIRIEAETSEVTIKADSMFDGYIDEQIAESKIDGDGYFHTGDLGALDSHGNLLITGRLKLLIEVGGQKVNPLEVEQVLAAHPAVAECVVLPMPVSATLTRLRAIVTLRTGTAEISSEDLRNFVKARLSAYKVPRVIELRDSLPRSPAGKVLRHLIES
jgi:acyl-CoA synthetase (AMP-forming)/AMP-acid ligase II